ncbi:uncharacterized protein TNCV_2935541 [Trichonephila clavipes]|nr:uncharacterized protein TNCV_2935541 [Trichonephila clavipes]
MRTYLSPQVVETIMPVYQRLASETILERCVAGKTQISKESLHSCIWRKCPKELFVFKRRLKIAVTDAIEKHNLGHVKSLESKDDQWRTQWGGGSWAPEPPKPLIFFRLIIILSI